MNFNIRTLISFSFFHKNIKIINRIKYEEDKTIYLENLMIWQFYLSTIEINSNRNRQSIHLKMYFICFK